jgi:hypothetical protein
MTRLTQENGCRHGSARILASKEWCLDILLMYYNVGHIEWVVPFRFTLLVGLVALHLVGDKK